MKRFWTYILSAALTVTIAAPAMAKEHGRDRDHHTAREWHEREHHRDNYYRHTRWNDHDRDDHPGWDKGRKTGWRGGNMPPGQAKKHRDYDRDDWARYHRHHHRRSTYSRGPIVTPQSTYPTRTYPTNTYPTRQTQHGRGPIPVPNVGQQAPTTAQKPSGQGGPIPLPR